MPMLPFLPWAAISDPVQFGRFHLIPAGVALAHGQIPAEHGAALRTILEAYGRRRPVDQDRAPLLRRDDLGITADLSESQIAEYFDFRTRLAGAVLSARRLFSHRYSNSDHTRLVIQGFTPERAGGAVIQQRRRDGVTNIIVPRGHLSVKRPHHVSDSFEMPRDVDQGLLVALEQAFAAAPPWWPRVSDAIRLFVGANTDAPDVSEHTELIDTVSAFSAIADVWDERGTVTGFVEVLPSPGAMPDGLPDGPKRGEHRVQQALKEGVPLRAIWIRDAYRLRGSFSHGRVTAGTYPSIWTEREHLLLASVAFPLYVKAMLEREGLYEMTEEDAVLNTAFDALTLLAPFETAEEDGGEEEDPDDSHAWSETMSRVRLHRWIEGHLESLYPPEEEGGLENSAPPAGEVGGRSDDAPD